MNVPRPETVLTYTRRRWQVAVVMFCAISYLALAVFSGSIMPIRIIKGTSMEPTLREGDVVFVRKLPFGELKTGDIVAYKVPQPFAADDFGLPVSALHRIVEIGDEHGTIQLTTKGDNSETDPWPVTERDYSGTMTLRIPWIAIPLVFLTSFKGILFLSLIFLLSLLYFPAVSIFYMVVVKRPKEIRALALSDNSNAGEYAKTLKIENDVQKLSSVINDMASGQKRLNGAITELSEILTVSRANDDDYERIYAVMSNIDENLKGLVMKDNLVSVQQNLSYNVLIVDDQMIYREFLKAMLEDNEEFKVVGEAADGTEALTMLDSVSPDLVLMDVNMPQMNGFETTQRIRELYPNTRVALISGYSDSEYIKRSNEVGAVGFLSKGRLSADEIKNVAASDSFSSMPPEDDKLKM